MELAPVYWCEEEPHRDGAVQCSAVQYSTVQSVEIALTLSLRVSDSRVG